MLNERGIIGGGGDGGDGVEGVGGGGGTQWLKTPPDKDKIHPSLKTTQTPYQPPTQWLKTLPIEIKYIPAPKPPKILINHLHSSSKHPR